MGQKGTVTAQEKKSNKLERQGLNDIITFETMGTKMMKTQMHTYRSMEKK